MSDQICSLLDLLPCEDLARTAITLTDARQKSWPAGAFETGGSTGVRSKATWFPCFTCAAYLRSVFPDATFATVALFANILTSPRRDADIPLLLGCDRVQWGSDLARGQFLQ